MGRGKGTTHKDAQSVLLRCCTEEAHERCHLRVAPHHAHMSSPVAHLSGETNRQYCVNVPAAGQGYGETRLKMVLVGYESKLRVRRAGANGLSQTA